MNRTSRTRGPHTLVGRDRELDDLRRLHSDSSQGNGRLVLLSGPAGIGKTSLLRVFSEEIATDDADLLTGHCYDLSITPPFGPWQEVYDQFSSGSNSDSEPSFNPFPDVYQRDEGASAERTFARVLQDLSNQSSDRPLVVILEDIHWADHASLELLRYVSRNLQNRTLLLIASYRDDEVTREHPLFALLPVIIRESDPARIDLRPLESDQIAELLNERYALPQAGISRLAEYLTRRSEGNPLFLVELLRSLEAEGVFEVPAQGSSIRDLDQFPLPTLIRQVIEARLTRISPETLALLESAAVIGERVPIDLWQRVSCATDDRLSKTVAESVDEHVITEQAGSPAVRFTHALIREVMYERIPLPRRRSLHLSTAETLAEAPAGDADAIAYHFRQAGDRRAIEWLVRAGMRARHQSAWLSAAERFSSAADLLADDPEHQRGRGWLLFYVGFLLRFTYDERSITCLTEAEQAGFEVGDQVLAAFSQYVRGSNRGIQPPLSMRRGLLELEQGVTALEHLDGIHRWRSTDEHAEEMIKALCPDPEGVQESILEPAVRVREPLLIPQRGVLVSRLAQSGRYLEARRSGEDFASRIETEFETFWQRSRQCVDVYSALGHAYAAMGSPEAAQLALATARHTYYAINDHAMLEFMLWIELNLIHMSYRTDRLAERAELGEQASVEWSRCREITVSSGTRDAPSHLVLFELEGRWKQARETATELAESHPWKAYFDQAHVILGRLARHQGEPMRAWEFVQTLLPDGPVTEPGNGYFVFAFEALALGAHLFLDSNDFDQASEWIEARERWLEWSGARLWKAENRLLWAHLHLANGEPDKARECATEALSTSQDPRQPLIQISIQRLLGQVHSALGNTNEAVECLAESISLANTCAAPFERALSMLCLAEHKLTCDHAEEIGAFIDEARSIADRLSAQPMLRRANRLKQQISRSPSADGHAGPLTPRELDVLKHLAAGRTDQEIANELFISRHTVMRHVSSILKKLNVRTRTEAAMVAVRRELV